MKSYGIVGIIWWVTLVLLILMKKKMAEPYDWKVGFLLLLFSHAATGLSLWGMGMAVVVVVLSVLLSPLQKKPELKTSAVYRLDWFLSCDLPGIVYDGVELMCS